MNLFSTSSILITLLATPFCVVNADDGAVNKRRVEEDLISIRTQLMAYQMLAGELPTTEQGLKALVEEPNPAPKRWTQLFIEVPRDPWGNEYVYARPGVHHPDSYDLSSKGPDGIAANADDIGNWNTEKIWQAKQTVLEFLAAIQSHGTLEELKIVDWNVLKSHPRHPVLPDVAKKTFGGVDLKKVKLESASDAATDKILRVRMVAPLSYDFELAPDPGHKGCYIIVGMHP